MECFHHEGRAAVGVCRACGKGICRECAEDLGRGIACTGCVEDARALIDYTRRHIGLVRTGSTILRASGRGILVQGLFIVAIGVVLLVWSYAVHGGFNPVVLIAGLCVLYGLYLLQRGRSVAKPPEE